MADEIMLTPPQRRKLKFGIAGYLGISFDKAQALIDALENAGYRITKKQTAESLQEWGAELVREFGAAAVPWISPSQVEVFTRHQIPHCVNQLILTDDPQDTR